MIKEVTTPFYCSTTAGIISPVPASKKPTQGREVDKQGRTMRKEMAELYSHRQHPGRMFEGMGPRGT